MASCLSPSSHGPKDPAVEPPQIKSRRLHLPIPAALVEEMMNSEVGIGSADFTYIKNRICFEVGKWSVDFRIVEVGNPGADFISVLHSILEGFYN